jgi:hypothetical protein
LPQGVDDASQGVGIEARGNGDAESVGEDDLDGRGGEWDEAGLRCGGADNGEKEWGVRGVGPGDGARRAEMAAGLVEVVAEGGEGDVALGAELGLRQAAELPLGD